MEQLQEFGRNRTPEKALEMIRDNDKLLKREISELRKRQDMLHSYAALIKKGRRTKPGEIALRMLPPLPIHNAPLEQAGGELATYKHLRECIMQLPNNGSPLGYVYSDFHSLLERPARPVQLVSFDPKGAGLRPAGEYLVGTAACSDEVPAVLARRMLAYALQNGLEICGPVWSVYLHDAVSAAKQEQYLTQLSAMVNHIKEGK